jgi:hypothetical protein
MASVTNNATAVAGNGLGGKTHILTFDDVSSTTAAVALQEAQAEGFTVVAVEGIANTNHFALQGTGTPSITDCTLVVTFDQNPA